MEKREIILDKLFRNPALEEAVLQMNTYGRRREPFVFMLDFELERPIVRSTQHLDPAEIRFSFNGIGNAGLNPTIKSEKPVLFKKTPVPFTQYQAAFDYVIKEIRFGNSFLVNLSAPTLIETSLSLDAIFELGNARYKLLLVNKFVCFSPEIFVQIRNNRMASFPMKGTIDAAVQGAEQLILTDLKEQAEHATIVDLIRNDLSQVATKVWVERYRYVERVETQRGALLQVSSEIAALLDPDWPNHIGDLLLALLPAGSVTGAPKPKTVDIIRQAEWYDRGYYTGIAGYFDGENLDSGVLIRFIENQDGQLIFKSGGGITAQSNALSEYQEMIDKVYLPIP